METRDIIVCSIAHQMGVHGQALDTCKNQIFEWADEFETAFSSTQIKSDFHELLDAYSSFRAEGKHQQARSIIGMMVRFKKAA